MENLPAPDQKVQLVVLEGASHPVYSTHVQTVTTHTIILAAPISGGEPVPLDPGQRVRVEYSHQGARVGFVTRVIAAGVDRIPILRLETPEAGEIERIQQRDFVRQEASLPLTFRVVATPDKAVALGVTHESRTRDISGSGVQILCPDRFEPGTQLEMHLDLNGSELHARGEVIRPLQQTNNGRWWIGVRFVGLTDRERDQIVRVVFDIQRDLRRRGLY